MLSRPILSVIIISACSLLYGDALKSQVIRYKPGYFVSANHWYNKKTKMDKKVWQTCSISTTAGEFIFDLDKKSVKDPGYYNEFLIKEFVKDDQNKRLTIYIKPHTGQRWNAYIIQFAGDNTTPLYLHEASSPRSYASTDTAGTFYADLPGNFPFVFSSRGMKKETGFAEKDKSTRLKWIATAQFKPVVNRVEMQPGVIYWTKGNGDTAVKQCFIVDSVAVVNTTIAKGINIACHDPEEPGAMYVVSYVYSNAYTPVYSWNPDATRYPVYSVAIWRVRPDKINDVYVLEDSY